MRGQKGRTNFRSRGFASLASRVLSALCALTISLSIAVAEDERVQRATVSVAQLQSQTDALSPGSAAARELLESRVDARVFDQMQASADGKAYVIVMLRSVAARGPMTEGERLAAIKVKQDAVIGKFAAAEYTPRYQYKTFPGFTGLVDAAGLAKLGVDPDVVSISADAEVHAVLNASVPHINADQVHAMGLTGAGVTVAVLDTGIDMFHADIADNVAAGAFTFLDNGATQNPGGQDNNGHGTNVAGIITSRGVVASVGVAPDADILSIKVLDGAGNGWLSDWVAGVDYVVANRGNYADLCAINMSLATNDLFSQCPCDTSASYNPAAQAAILAAKNVGIVTFAATGNNGQCGQMASPACLSAAFSVAATYDPGDFSPNDQITPFSNRNACTDLSAPGASITAPGLGGGLSTFQGTSQATPHVAGVAALMCQKCTAFDSPDSMVAIMKATGVATTDPGCAILPHAPRVDALAAVIRMNELCGEDVKFSQPPFCECKADFDKDGDVTASDILVVTACVDGDCSGCFTNSCDVDCDGDVDIDDINATTCLFTNLPADVCCPPFEGEDIESNVDWVDMQPNVVVADDFTSDGRPITGVRWWGSVLKEPDIIKPGIDVTQGLDLWRTTPGATSQDFTGTPIPADFFDPGSDPFEGFVDFDGVPLPASPPLGATDTIVRRLADAPMPDCPDTAVVVPIEIIALSLRSSAPITVTYNGGQNPEAWDIRVFLANGPQQQGTMTIRQQCTEGGIYDSTLNVDWKAVFTRQSDGATRVYDTILFGFAPTVFTSSGTWVYQPDPIFGHTVALAGTQIDTDGDGLFDTVLGIGTSNFFAGYEAKGCFSCNEPSTGQNKPPLTQEQAMWAAHGVNPPNQDDAVAFCCIPFKACFAADPVECAASGGVEVPDCGGCPLPERGASEMRIVGLADQNSRHDVGVTDEAEPDTTTAGGIPGVKCAPVGVDGFTTLCDPDNPTSFDFSNDPIPADFFFPGSEPFDGVVSFGGLGGFPADTIIQRNAQMCFDGPLPVSQTIPIEIVQLDLLSCTPIKVSGIPSAQYDVFVSLAGPQQQGTMTATKETPTGGTYTASLPVNAQFFFQDVGSPLPVLVGPLAAPPITLQTDPPGFWLQDCCDTGVGSEGFFPGWKDDKEGLTGPCCKPTCHPNPAGGHEHCVWPPDCPPCPVKPPPGGGGDLNWDGWFISFHLPEEDAIKVPDAYVIDDGVMETSIGLTNGGDLLWLNQFDVVAGSELINSLRVSWGDIAVGTAATVMLYDDPNNDGDPADALALAIVNTATGVGFETIDIADTVAGAAGDSFFVGVLLTHAAGVFPADIDQSSQQGRSWITAGNPGTLNAGNMALNPAPSPTSVIGDPPGSLDGNWLLRAGAFASPAEQTEPLALYYCDQDFVSILPTALPACDTHPVEEYRVDLDDCCLVHANVDPRSGAIPAAKDAFFEDKCSEYLIDIEAVVGHEFIQDPATLECIEVATGMTLDGPFWGWHTAPRDNGINPAIEASVKMGSSFACQNDPLQACTSDADCPACVGGANDGAPCDTSADCDSLICIPGLSTCVLTPNNDWLYGPWSPVVPVCSLPNMAFELLTQTPSDAPDCNHNWIPDQCEVDCQPNGIPDDCDINGGGSSDNNGNGIPDECECCISSAPRDVKIADSTIGNPLKTLTANRTLIIQAGGDPGCTGQAIRVMFTDLAPPYDLWNGEQLWLGVPTEVSETSTSTVATPLPASTWSELQCTPECRTDWDTYGDLHVYHEGIVPGSLYDIQVVDCQATGCVTDETVFSPPLTLPTAIYGDTVRDCTTFPCAPPEGQPISTNDILAVIAKFANAPGAPRKARADIEPRELDRLINIADVLHVVNGFSGVPYPFLTSVPDPCP